MEELDLKWESMAKGIDAQPVYLRGGTARALFAAADDLPRKPPSRIFLVGCGDSHYAGLAVRHAFERWSGIPTEALESLEFSRYAVEAAPSDALVVAVSNSGRVTRTVECAVFAERRGIPTVAITYDPASRLAEAARVCLPYAYEDVGFGPGTLSYLASLVAPYALGLRLAQLTGGLTDDGSARRWTASRRAATWPRRRSATPRRPPRHLRNECRLIRSWSSSAGDRTTGRRCSAWQSSSSPPAIRPSARSSRSGPTSSTSAPVLARSRWRSRRTAAAWTASASSCARCATSVGGDELLSPLVTALPLEILALEFARGLGLTMLGFDDENRRLVNVRQIFDSALPDA